MIKKMSLLLIILTTAISCSRTLMKDVQVNNWKSKTEKNSYEASFDYFSGDMYKYIKAENNNHLNLSINTDITKGNIIIALLNERAMPIWISGKMEGIKKATPKINITRNKKYTIDIQGENASGKFNINWQLNNN